LSYDTSRLELAAVELGSLTQGFSLAVNPNAQAGTVAVDAVSDAPVTAPGPGSVAVLVLNLKDDAAPGPAFVDLQQSLASQGGSERTALVGQDALGHYFQFILSPAVADAPGSPDDGVVTVL
jgi:hypothetical protein